MNKFLTIIFLLAGSFCQAQNLILNNSFEDNGQPECNYWFDKCGNELTYLCQGIIDTGCNFTNRGAQLFQDAPSGGGQWCMKVATGSIETAITGSFIGVYEMKIWMRADTGARGSVLLYFKNGEYYTGMGSESGNYLSWTLLTIRDTIRSPSDTIIIKLTAAASRWGVSDIMYFDLPEFKMIEYWMDIENTRRGNEKHVFPIPFSNQLTFQLAMNEPITIMLYDFLGKQMLRHVFTNSTTINTEQLSGGIYFYELRNDKGVVSNGKVIRQ